MFPATESNNVGACTKRKLAFTFVDICIVGLGKYTEKIRKSVIDSFPWTTLSLFTYLRTLLLIKREFEDISIIVVAL